MIIGHKSIISFFDRAVSFSKLASTYCFVGPEQVGKRTLARYFAERLLGTDSDRLDVHPDFFYVERAVDEKTGKRKKDLTIEQARNLKSRLQTTSWFSGYRVVIIDEVERLNEEAGNALLKLLEEPSEKTIFFLLTTDDALLLPTIQSRSQMLFLKTLSDSDLKNELIQKYKAASDRVDIIIKYSWGRPGRALDVLNNIERFDQLTEREQQFGNMLAGSLYEKFAVFEKLFGGKKEQAPDRSELDALLEFWMMLLREKMVSDLRERQNHWLSLIDMSMFVRRSLRENVNPRLLFDVWGMGKEIARKDF